MVEISEQGSQSISAAEIAALEGKLGAKLSDSYRRFLMLNNGGRPSPDIIDIEGVPGSPTDVQIFFGIGRNIESSDLSWNLDLIAERYPGHHLLPIACDSGGNLFCLEVSQGIASEVMYCDLNDSCGAFYKVALHFDEFLNKIRAWE
jgi:hypothetical protein